MAFGGCALVAIFFGNTIIRPYITSDLVSDSSITNNIEGEVELFDGGSHSIEIDFNQAEYEDMLNTFKEEGEKDNVRADITIDGTLIENVALRLKGNSTLQSLRGDGGMPGGGEMPRPEGMEPSGEQPSGDSSNENIGDEQVGSDALQEDGPMPMSQLSEDSPEELPWLISFDEYEEGRGYQGRTEIALRPAAGNSDTALNESLALSITQESDQITQAFSLSTVSVNGSEEQARLLIDSPDAQWADNLGSGVLYKGRAGGSFDYAGEDPTDYEESFEQINAEGSYDTQPVINLVKFVNESDDEEFSNELAEFLDVESFAKYLATQELISNSDAMDGPGNNFYLWYDTEEQKFTVLSWDLNLSLSEMGGGAMGRGGAGGPGSEGMPDMAEGGPGGEGMPEMPEGGPGGEGMPEMPEGGPGGEGMPEMPEGGPGGSSSGILKERFLASPEFHEMYEAAYADLYEQIIASGYAEETLNSLTETASSIGDERASSAAETIRQKLSTTSAQAPEESTSMFGNRE